MFLQGHTEAASSEKKRRGRKMEAREDFGFLFYSVRPIAPHYLLEICVTVCLAFFIVFPYFFPCEVRLPWGPCPVTH